MSSWRLPKRPAKGRSSRKNDRSVCRRPPSRSSKRPSAVSARRPSCQNTRKPSGSGSSSAMGFRVPAVVGPAARCGAPLAAAAALAEPSAGGGALNGTAPARALAGPKASVTSVQMARMRSVRRGSVGISCVTRSTSSVAFVRNGQPAYSGRPRRAARSTGCSGGRLGAASRRFGRRARRCVRQRLRTKREGTWKRTLRNR